MSSPYLTPKAEREMEERFTLQRRALELLNIISAEFESDPMSVQCFDLRIVEETKRTVSRLKQLKSSWDI